MKINAEKIKNAPLSVRILLVTVSLTVLSFFVQSALPPTLSSAESDAVSGFFSLIIPENTVIGGFIHDNIRKIGHFCEYGLLGIQLALFAHFSETKNKANLTLRFTAFALFVALCDETVQIFSGRGPQISDVWLDFFGFCTFGAISYGIIFLKNRFFKKI